MYHHHHHHHHHQKRILISRLDVLGSFPGKPPPTSNNKCAEFIINGEKILNNTEINTKNYSIHYIWISHGGLVSTEIKRSDKHPEKGHLRNKTYIYTKLGETIMPEDLPITNPYYSKDNLYTMLNSAAYKPSYTKDGLFPLTFSTNKTPYTEKFYNYITMGLWKIIIDEDTNEIVHKDFVYVNDKDRICVRMNYDYLLSKQLNKSKYIEGINQYFLYSDIFKFIKDDIKYYKYNEDKIKSVLFFCCSTYFIDGKSLNIDVKSIDNKSFLTNNQYNTIKQQNINSKNKIIYSFPFNFTERPYKDWLTLVERKDRGCGINILSYFKILYPSFSNSTAYELSKGNVVCLQSK